jgi:hypothetical protein
MYNPSILWYDKKDVLNIFPFSERTYFRKLKSLDPKIRTRSQRNSQGKTSTLVYFKDLKKVFGSYRKPNRVNDPEIRRKYIGTLEWDIIGNIVPEYGTTENLIQSMRFVKEVIERKIKPSTKDWFFYSIEKNSKDENYHTHFLIRTNLKIIHLEKILDLICETDFGGKNRMWVRKYDFENHQYSGSFYSYKTSLNDKGEGSVFDELL